VGKREGEGEKKKKVGAWAGSQACSRRLIVTQAEKKKRREGKEGGRDVPKAVFHAATAYNAGLSWSTIS